MSFATIRDELERLYGRVRAGASADAFDRFQVRYSVRLPDDLKASYSLMDGADDSTNPGGSWMRFWPIHEFVPAKDKPRAARDDGRKLFVFADYAIACVYYVVDLRPGSGSFGHVHALGATRVTEVAQTFAEFVQLVLANSDKLHTYS